MEYLAHTTQPIHCILQWSRLSKLPTSVGVARNDRQDFRRFNIYLLRGPGFFCPRVAFFPVNFHGLVHSFLYFVVYLLLVLRSRYLKFLSSVQHGHVRHAHGWCLGRNANGQ